MSMAISAVGRWVGFAAAAIMAMILEPLSVLSEETAPTPPAQAAQPQTAAAQADGITRVPMVFVRQKRDRLPPLSLLDFPPADIGYAGAQLGIDDNNTTGRFLKQEFSLGLIEGETANDLIAKVKERIDAGVGFFITDVSADTLLKMSDAIKDRDAVLFNASEPDQRLREEECRLNVKHTAASRVMLTDALSQYLAWKRWRRVVIVTGPAPEDKLYAEAFKYSAKRFGLRVEEELDFTYTAGSRRADGGFEQVQKQIPSFTQNLPEYDVLIVADEADQFGNYFPYRLWKPRPVAGTHGLHATAWHPASELWGASQFQNRFQRKAERTMRPLDYSAWMAVRSIGEAATRRGTGDPKALIDYMLSEEFELAAFKGQKLTFRQWNAQLRQPIFVAMPKLHVTVSPQPGFLHQRTILDTMGIDKPETKCTAFEAVK